VKQWEIIADNLRKAGWMWGAYPHWIRAGEQSSLLTRFVATATVTTAAHERKAV
jgi:hypothetical protein